MNDNDKRAIEEMARAMCRNGMRNGNCAADNEPCQLECVYGFCAERLFCADYRKQSGWISVEERLPDTNDECLVAAKVGDRTVVDLGKRVGCFDIRTGEHYCEWMITNDWDEGEGCEITHWMPLPSPPDMKGGAE